MKLILLLGVLLFISTNAWASSRQALWRERKTHKSSMIMSDTADMLCNVLVKASNKLLDEKSVNINSIKSHLRNDCTKLPKKNNLVEQCEMAVDRYLSDILRHIQSGIESDQICPLIQKRTISTAFVQKPKVNNLESNTTCVLCEFIVHVVDAMASSNRSEQELVKIFEKVCSLLPNVTRAECKAFVDAEAADIIDLLVRDFPPDKVCKTIKICPKSLDVAFLTKSNLQTCGLCDYLSTYIKAGYPTEKACSHFSTDNRAREQCEILVAFYKPNICSQLPLCSAEEVVPERPIQPKANPVECSLCQFVVGFVETYIKNNKSEAAAEAALEKVCGILPHTLNASCVAFVEKEGPKIFDYIIEHGSPDAVCIALKICNNKTEIIASPPTSMPSASIQCTMCEFVLGYVEKTIGNNHTLAAITAALDKACDLLPKSLQPNCTSFAKDAAPVIFVLLLKNESAAQICAALKMCNATQSVLPQVTHDVIEIEKPKANPVECSLCQFVIGFVEKYIQNNKSEAAVEAALEKVCGILPHTLNASCVAFVEKEGPKIFEYIIEHGSPDAVCIALKICTNKTETIASPPTSKPSASIQCTMCEFVLGYVEKTIGNNHTLPAITAALDKACDLLPKSLQPNCTSFAKDAAPVIFVLLLKNESAAQICTALKMCNATQSVLPQVTPVVIEIEKAKANPVECSLCQFVVGFVEKYIQNNKSEAAAEAALEKVCGILPHTLNASCVAFVEKEGPKIFQYIIEHGSPDAVCIALKICNNKTEEVVVGAVRKIESVPEAYGNSTACALCQFVITYVDKTIENNKSEAAIEHALENVCKLLPATMNASCVGFVDDFGPILVQLLEKYVTPDAVCIALRLCNNKTEIIAPEPVEMPTVTPQCTICEFAMVYLEKAIGNNQSEAAVDAVLDQVCELLPPAIKSNCTHFVNTYGTTIANLIAKNESTAQICTALKVCNGTQTIAENVPIEEPKANPVECSLCQFVIGFVEKYIQNNKSEAAVEAALEKVCGILPHTLNASCVAFVEKEGPKIFEYIIEHGSPDAVCIALKICTNKTETIASPPTSKPSASIQCTMCEFVLGYVEKTIGNNHTLPAITAALDKACDLLPKSLQPNCTSFAKDAAPVIFVLLLKNESAAQICTALKMCNATQSVLPQVTHDVIEIEKPKANPVECSLCQFVIGFVEKYIQNNKSEAAVEAALEKVCGILPHTLNASCVAFVEKEGPKIFQYIIEHGSPDAVCIALKICNNKTEEVTRVESVKVVEPEQESVGSPLCSLCEFVVGFVLKVVENNKTEAAIEAALEKVCLILPQSSRNECVAFIDKYGTELIELIEKLGTPKAVCAALGVCAFNSEKVAPIVAAPSTQCTLCKFIVAYVDAVIQANQSEAAFDSALETVCKILPHTLSTSCVQFVDTFGPRLLEYIAKYETPDRVCDALKLCKNGSEIVEQPKQMKTKSVGNDVECTLCKYVVSYVNVLLENNATEQEITRGLEVICKALPSTYHNKCEAFVTTYGPILPQLIAELDDPNVVCDILKMCKKSNETNVENLQAFPCTLCEYLVNYLDAIIKSNATEVKFEDELEKACKILPNGKLQAECKTVVELYAKDMIKFLVELGDPKAVCQEIGLCDK